MVVIGSSHRRRAKSPLGTVLIINLLGKGLTPRACMGDGGSIWWAPASTYVLSAGSRSVEGVYELFIKQVVFVRLSAVIVIIKVYFFKRMSRVKSLMSADNSAKLVRLSVGQKVKPQERTNNSPLESGVCWQINNRGGIEISGFMGFTRFAFTAIACFGQTIGISSNAFSIS